MLATLISRGRRGVFASAVALAGVAPWTAPAWGDELNFPKVTPPSLGSPRKTQVVEVVDRVKACVVNIHSERTVSDNKPFNPRTDLAQTQHRVNGMGTGIIIDPRGYLITNYHVVDDVYLLRVRLVDGTSLPAKIIARDPENDLAVLKIDPVKPLQVIPLGTSSDLMLAEPVIAIGNAFGYEHTVTTGIVSALKRDVTLNKEVSYKSLIQTSAGINPGNSGGPLLNVHGELIGVNVAIRANAQNIAFALPIDQVLKTTSEMIGAKKRGQSHGIVGHDMVDSSEAPTKRWVVIDSVEPKSSAEQAGLKTGDVVDKVGDVPVKCLMDIERAFLETAENAKLDVVVKRTGGPVKAELALHGAGRTVPATTVANTNAGGGDVIWKKLGLKLEAVTPDAVTHVNKELRGGLLIKEVSADGPAARAGFQRGDILIGLHQWETITADNVSFVLGHADLASFSPVRFFVVRGKELRRGLLPNFE